MNNRLQKWIINVVFFVFGLALIGWTASLTIGVMEVVLPNDPYVKWFSLALFDGGVLTWLFVYIGKARGTPQRGISLLLTVMDFIGVALMVAGALYLSGQELVSAPDWMGRGLINGTIGATLLNLAGLYYYHATEPEVREAIQAQELEDTLNEEALEQARRQVETRAQQLGAIMANRVTARMKYRLRLPMTEQERAEFESTVIDAEAYDMSTLPPPQPRQDTFWSAVKSFFGRGQSRRQSDTTQYQSSMNSRKSDQEPDQESDQGQESPSQQ